MRRLIACAAILLASTVAALAQSACGGSDLIARMKREEPERYRRLAAEAKAIPFGEARYWRIQKGKAAPSFLFGTAHISDPRALEWVAEIAPRIRRSRSVAVENADVDPRKPNPAAIFKMAAMMPAKPGELLANHIPAAELARLAAVAAPRMALSEAAVTRLRPWIIYLTLAIPACESERAKLRPVVDSAIAAHGEDKGLTVRSLETIEEMLSAVVAPPMEAQIDVLRSVVATHEQAEDILETLIRVIDRGETGLVMAWARDESARSMKDVKNYDVFMEHLIDRRNETMFRNARPLVDEGGAFLAVGALHLPGRNGLVRMFREAGYRVTPVRLKRTSGED